MHLKTMCILLFLDAVFCIYIKFILSHVLFKANVSLLIFYLDDLSIDVRRVGVLKSCTLIVLLSLSSLISVNICFVYLGASLSGA